MDGAEYLRPPPREDLPRLKGVRDAGRRERRRRSGDGDVRGQSRRRQRDREGASAPNVGGTTKYDGSSCSRPAKTGDGSIVFIFSTAKEIKV